MDFVVSCAERHGTMAGGWGVGGGRSNRGQKESKLGGNENKLHKLEDVLVEHMLIAADSRLLMLRSAA